MVGALVVWAGIATFKSVASIGANPVVQEKIVGLETGIKNLPALTKVGCWATAQSRMKVEVWIAKPFVENVNSLKLACLNKQRWQRNRLTPPKIKGERLYEMPGMYYC